MAFACCIDTSISWPPAPCRRARSATIAAPTAFMAVTWAAKLSLANATGGRSGKPVT
ncbi:MAG: hypothetical protein R2755_07275 [Acidimicrobiales bacterium]